MARIRREIEARSRGDPARTSIRWTLARMVKRSMTADPRHRLRSYLDDLLSDGDQAELAEHLDAAPPARRPLERLAAGAGSGTTSPPGQPAVATTSARSTSAARRGPATAEPGEGLELGLPRPARRIGISWAGSGLTRSSACIGPGRHGGRAQGVRPGARTGSWRSRCWRPQLAGSGRGPPAVRPRGQGGRGGRPRARRRRSTPSTTTGAGLPYLVMQYVAGQVAPGADRPRRPAARPRRSCGSACRPRRAWPRPTRRAWSTATSSRRTSCWRTASSGSRSPTSAWPAPSTTPA